MPLPRRSRQSEPFKDAFARALEKEDREFDQDDDPHSSGCRALQAPTALSSGQEPVSDLYRQHSHQQSMEGG